MKNYLCSFILHTHSNALKLLKKCPISRDRDALPCKHVMNTNYYYLPFIMTTYSLFIHLLIYMHSKAISNWQKKNHCLN